MRQCWKTRSVTVGVLVLFANLFVVSSLGFASVQRTPPRRWVEQVCAAVEPAAVAMLADARTWPVLSSSAATPDDIVHRVDVADQTFAAIVRLAGAMRSGAKEAGVPAIPGGSRAASKLRATLGELQDRLRVTRSAIAEFRLEFPRDPGGAMDELTAAFADAVPTVDLGLPSAILPSRLRVAFEKSPRCVDVADTVSEFATVTRSKLGGGGSVV